MNHFYQSQQNALARRATEPVTLAPTASMIDPNLDNHGIQQHSHMNAAYARPQIANHQILPNAFPPNTNASLERALPSREIDGASIEDAYVQFIMYCNPSIPADTDTTELRKGFRTPPKTDGKMFSPFTLFGLISRLEAHELKTWTQLVLELGVEPPDTSKNQSTQKVQQYAVRLKRWLRAFHVDAFFNHLHGKPSTYIAERPETHESLTEKMRDDIPPEEDHAIRALLPEWRPKRGRRKVYDLEAENEAASSTNKKQHTRSSSADFTSMFEDQYSAAPSSAIPWSAQPQQTDPWAAAQVAIAPKKPSTGQTPNSTNQVSAQNVGQQMRWRFTSNESPSSPYPQSAITPRNTFVVTSAIEEPKSAHPSTNTSRSLSGARRRRGAAVSSAWPSTTSTTSGKLRGRPPGNRSMQDGPFSTFPVNPSTKEGPAINVSTSRQTSPTLNKETLPLGQQALTFMQQPAIGDASPLRRPSKLQLQVPEHTGGQVRLATPPRVLINGESKRQTTNNHERRASGDFFNHLDEMDDDDDDGKENDGEEGGTEDDDRIDWKRRALTLKRKLMEKEEELKMMKRRVLDAVM